MRDAFSIYDSTQDLMLCELEKIVQNPEITPQALDYVGKIVDILKDIDKIYYYNDERSYSDGYSMRSEPYYRGNSYGNNRGNSGSSRRVNMRNGMNGYSRNSSSKNDMLDHLYMALDSAANDEERRRVQGMINDLENNN